jgi:hypothetical protein
MSQKVPRKAETIRQISELIGIPEYPLNRGSSIPSAFFTSIAIEMGIPVVNGMPQMARKIIESSHLQWNEKFSSESTPSGGGGTVTAIGLLQVKNAVLEWLGKPIEPLPPEVIFDEWAPNADWQELRRTLPKELREIASRPGASDFRELVLTEYDLKCAITQNKTIEAIEVAHIVPYFGPESDEVQNAIPMRVDIHRLFDRGLIRIIYDHGDKKFRTKVHEDVLFDYAELDNKELILPIDPLSAPSKLAIIEQHKLHQELWAII